MTKHMHVERTHPTLPTQKHNVHRFSFQTEFYSADDCYNLLPPVARSIYLFSRLNLPVDPRIKFLRILPIYHCDPIIHEFFSRFHLLRVLVIFNTSSWFSSLPLVITKLFHLRYLQIRFDGDIPESIAELQNLQTLICSGYSPYVNLPGKIWMMKNMRNISLDWKATNLPSPRGESSLNLEEFFGLCYTSCTKEVFSGIPNLKKLIIHLPFLLYKNCPDYCPNELMDMSSLRKLEAFKFYNWRYYWPMDISLKSYVFPTSLKRLSLTKCNKFFWADISSTVMMLPNLEELKLKYCIIIDAVWRLSDEEEFKSLKLLLLSKLNLKHWEASNDNFPNLNRLVMKNCADLQEIPADFEDELHDCSVTAEDSARKIVQEQEKMGNNPLNLYIHKSYYADD